MNTITNFMGRLFLLAALSSAISGCEAEDGVNGTDGTDGQDGVDGLNGEDGQDGEDFTPAPEIFENKSAVDPLVTMSSQFSFVQAYSLLSTPDVVGDDFQLAGSADGAGFLKDGDGYMYVVNCEDSYAVARIRFDQYMNPVSGDYLLNSGVSDYARQCSATMWEASIHGGSKDLFLSASESINYDVKGIDPWVENPTPQEDFGLDALGEFSWENAVPLPKDAYSGKTVIIGGDDDSSGSEGQVVLYYSENADDDLENGKIYVLRAKEVSDGMDGKKAVESDVVYNESSFDLQSTYEVEFVEIENGKDLTKDEMETASSNVLATQFMRVEDVDYQKGADFNARNVYFAVTGRGPGRGTYNDWGTVYKLELDENSPLSGKLTQIVSGNTDTNNMDGNLGALQSPDNICVTENFVYIQEDPNSFSRGHSAYIYQSDLNGQNIQHVLELIVRQDLDPDNSTGFSGEFGSLIDVSDKIGEPGTFLLAVQPHYWESSDFKNLDGHTNADCEDDQASQIVLLRGLPR
ncbi:alkaline phosphatase PhoX [uncultured Christiangramia sp.]|uniref:alkaline phosphatase PhoX n=1 Tax=Christiangramia sp. 3-2217-3z TaxID=3417564 RepID=UPI0026220A68|nr:alkaline phosphatase PhoX [uncultured Christiangramia sp.]